MDFSMRFLQWFNDTIEAGFGLGWSAEEKSAMLSILYAVYMADGEFSENEQKQWRHLARCLSLSDSPGSNWRPLNLSEAIAVLRKDEDKISLGYVWIGKAIYSESFGLDAGDDAGERQLINDLSMKFGLDRARLDTAIEDARRGGNPEYRPRGVGSGHSSFNPAR